MVNPPGAGLVTCRRVVQVSRIEIAEPEVRQRPHTAKQDKDSWAFASPVYTITTIMTCYTTIITYGIIYLSHLKWTFFLILSRNGSNICHLITCSCLVLSNILNSIYIINNIYNKCTVGTYLVAFLLKCFI